MPKVPDAKPSTRFSDRVENYVRYRPSYPSRLIEELIQRADISKTSVVADVGAGTGILTGLLLPYVGRMIAIEPNAPMRAAAESALGPIAAFVSVDGTAEATGLPNHSVDLITVAQAFHWFDPVPTKREFTRILKPGGHVALIWNERLTADTPFLGEYDRLLKTHATGYDQVKHTRIDRDAISAFFSPNDYALSEVPNEQTFDLAGLEGRSLSSSYVPAQGQPGHTEFMTELGRIFAAHAHDGQVSFRYQTRLFLGRL